MLLTSVIQNVLLASSLMDNFQKAIDNIFPQLNEMTSVAIFYGSDIDCEFIRVLSQNAVKYNSPLIVTNYRKHKLRNLNFLGERFLNVFFFQTIQSLYDEISNLETRQIKFLSSYLIVVRESLNLSNISGSATSPETNISQIMKFMWKYKLLDMVLLCWNINFDLFGYTFNPFFIQYEIKLFEIRSKDGHFVDHHMKKYYWNKTKKLNFYNVTTFMHQSSPKVLWIPSIFRSPGFFYFGGRDGFLTSVMSRLFNTRYTYYTFHADNLLQFKMNVGNTSVLRTRIRGSIAPGDDFIPNNLKLLDSKSIENTSGVIQTYLPDFVMMSKLLSYKKKRDYELMYPHEFDHICVMVPNRSKQIAFSLNKIFRPLPIKLVPVTLVIFVVIWKICRDQLRFRDNDYSLVLMYTIGMYLATSADHRSKIMTERILMASLFIFSQVTIVAVSGLLYQSFVVPEQTSNIQTLEELANSTYTIFISKEYAENFQEWGQNLNPKIKQKLRPIEEYIMTDMIIKQNTSYAYVLSQTRAKLIMQKKELWEDEQNLFHLMEECLFPGLMSYEIKKGSPLKYQAQLYIENIIQHGFTIGYIQWTKRFMFAQKEANLYMPGYFDNRRKQANPISLDDLTSLIVLYVIGLSIGLIIFVLEFLSVHLIFGKFRFERNRNFAIHREPDMSLTNNS